MGTSTHLACFLLLGIVSSSIVKDGEKNEPYIHRYDNLMSLDAQQALFDEKGEEGLSKIKQATPLYRKDQPSHYVSYWEVAYQTEYFIVSSGPQTGDYDVMAHGDYPLPTSHLKAAAKRRGCACVRFYVMTSGGEMMCANEEGMIVATTIPDSVLLGDLLANSTDMVSASTLHDYVQSKADEQASIWRQHAAKVQQHIWGEEDELSADEDTGMEMSDQREAEEKKPFQARAIIPGESVQVVTGSTSSLVEVRLRHIAGPTGQHVPRLLDQQKLCMVIRGCETGNDQFSVLSSDHLVAHPTYIDIELDSKTEKVFKKKEFVFAVDIVKSNGSISTRYFGVMYQPRRQRRGTEYKSWGSWREYSIGMQHIFPDYNQFTDQGCAVGCGPVAWAMVFGYYDRRDHNNANYMGSKGLYKTGADGTQGNPSQIAPSWTDSRMKNYIIYLNDILGTFCLGDGGATLALQMPRVESFFKDRQTQSSATVTYKRHWFKTLVALYSDGVQHWVRDRLMEGLPVIIGWRVDSYLSWHYPVATMYRVKTRRYRRCLWRWCGQWQTDRKEEIYLHMGWGGSGNKWTKLEAYYGITATY